MNRAASEQRNNNSEEALEPGEREQLRDLIHDIGERETARYLAVSRQTLGRAIAGLPLQRGTISLVRERVKSRGHAR